MKDIQDGRVRIDPEVRVTLTDEDAEPYLIKDGDILLNRTNSPDLVGKAGIYRGDGKAVFASYLVRLELDREQVDPDFVIQILASEGGQRHIRQLATRAVSQANLNPTTFKNHFQIPLPALKEQVGIRDVLMAWDTAIEKTEALIVLRTKQKAWVLSQLASLPGQAVKLGTFLKKVSRPVPRPSDPYWALGIRSHGKGTFQRFVEDPSGVDMDELYAVQRDDLIVNITFAWEGAVATVKPGDERCLVSHRFPTYEIDREIADPGFVKYIVNSKSFFSQLALISPGGAGRNRVLNKNDFLKLPISLPSLVEKRRLAQSLQTMDLLIETESSRVAALRIQKRGLMQKLLTGQWRVRTETEEVSA
jgi:type I restriction enzyme S subunit